MFVANEWIVFHRIIDVVDEGETNLMTIASRRITADVFELLICLVNC